jgi:hypothetical protein
MVKVPRGVLGGSGKGVVEGMASEFGGVVEDVENVGMDGVLGPEARGRRRCWMVTVVRWVAPTTGSWQLPAERSHGGSWGSRRGANVGGVSGGVETEW